MDEKDELVKEFLIESFEYLDSLDEDLLSLERNASDPDLLARIFRALHTIKGTGGFLDFDNLVGIAHAGEGLLDSLRKGRLETSEAIASTLFDLVDAIREVLQSIEQTGRDGVQKYEELIKTLTALQGGKLPVEPAASEPAGHQPDADETAGETSEPEAASPEEEPDEEEDEGMSGYFRQIDESLNTIETELQSMTVHPLDSARIEQIMKLAKRIVGSSSIMGFRKLISVVISIREQLEYLLSGETTMSEDLRAVLLAHVDASKEIAKIAEETETDNTANPQELIDRCLAERKADLQDSIPEELPSARDSDSSADASQEEPASSGVQQDAAEPHQSENQATAVEKKSSKSQASIQSRAADSNKRSLADNNIRVNVDLLDALMNLVGELVLTRNQILQFTSAGANPGLANSAQNLDLITTELQEGVMKTRMQTIGTIWKKFPRVVRDLAKLCDKQASVEMEGEDTELDKTIIEAIKDPLTHIIRNSVDHGIESPEERTRVGKPPQGRLLLRAFHEGGHVNIEISDDGAGIDPEKIKKKALANGVVSQAEAARMSDREILNLIFVSGLSTAEQVSNISGRGVGMDVVKTYIERIGGTVDINSKLGQGTTIKIKIPLTLAIIPALIVKICDERFALPQVNLLELVRLEGDQIQSEIEMIHDTPVHRLRGKLLPLVYLDKELGLKDATLHEKSDDELAVINIVVLQAEDQPFGLVVNEVVDTEEVVVKPLTKLLKHVTTYAGATIMGDGKIALILDVAGLARKGGVMSHEEHTRAKTDAAVFHEESRLTTLLLARLNRERQIAIPLSMISRLEEIDATTIEKSGHQEIVQYRDHLMPLVRLTEILRLPGSTKEGDDSLQVVVCSKNGVNIGMVVEEIVDIVEENVEVKDRPGVIKSVEIIQNKATELLSVQEILDNVDTGIFEREEPYVFAA